MIVLSTLTWTEIQVLAQSIHFFKRVSFLNCFYLHNSIEVIFFLAYFKKKKLELFLYVFVILTSNDISILLCDPLNWDKYCVINYFLFLNSLLFCIFLACYFFTASLSKEFNYLHKHIDFWVWNPYERFMVSLLHCIFTDISWIHLLKRSALSRWLLNWWNLISSLVSVTT